MGEHQLETVADRRESMINTTTRTTVIYPIGLMIAFVWESFIATEPAISLLLLW